jgi:hypothetical protein
MKVLAAAVLLGAIFGTNCCSCEAQVGSKQCLAGLTSAVHPGTGCAPQALA